MDVLDSNIGPTRRQAVRRFAAVLGLWIALAPPFAAIAQSRAVRDNTVSINVGTAYDNDSYNDLASGRRVILTRSNDRYKMEAQIFTELLGKRKAIRNTICE